MRIGFVLNDVFNETLPSTTIRLALTAANMGHEVWLTDVGSFAYDPDEKIYARSVSPSRRDFKNDFDFMKHLQSKEAKKERITVDALDILFLRNDPASDYEKPWAQHAGYIFGRTARRHGVIVLNDPDGLAKAINKMYFQHFPKIVRLKTLITRNHDEIREFYLQNNKKIILKPLQGSAGRSVFFAGPEDENNLNQMVDAVIRDGYAIAQEFFSEATKGDVRLFMMNGKPFKYRGKYAAFKRVSGKGDIRSNIHAGGHAEPAKITDKMLELAEIIRPKLVQDGMFLVGLDIVGDKLLEVNVFSPGGLHSAQKFEKVDFAEGVIHALEKKVLYKKYYHKNFDNKELNTL
ncbi:glutathione synthetase [Nitrosophilus alvini]|uniref:glutathione synthetase n=1 Tax=Nitrosophilus alvini TaxID=2714855 RepID=UPI00190A9CF1|nr:glutathione synthetase [Nitrosophilus alvini]